MNNRYISVQGLDARARLPVYGALCCWWRVFIVLCLGVSLQVSAQVLSPPSEAPNPVPPGARPQPVLPTMMLDVGGHRLRAEIASTSQQRYMGLSFRQTLGVDEGMLFVYPAERRLNFTMRNTLIPLSIAFISSDWVITDIQQMDVGPNQFFASRYKAQYALEVNQGWFAAKGVGIGDRVVMDTSQVD